MATGVFLGPSGCECGEVNGNYHIIYHRPADVLIAWVGQG